MGEGRGGEEKALPSLPLFRFHLSSFPPETPDTQATEGTIESVRIKGVFVLSGLNL